MSRSDGFSKRSIEKGKVISYLISYHIYLLLLIYLSILSYPELKKAGKKDYPAHIYKPLHSFLQNKFKSVNEGINCCVYEMYKQQPESLRLEIENLKNQAFEKEKELKELEEAQVKKVISDNKKVISYLKDQVILEKKKDISLSFDELFKQKRIERIFNEVTSRMGYRGDIKSLKNDIEKLWNMSVEELEIEVNRSVVTV